jgi:hypothetical protein
VFQDAHAAPWAGGPPRRPDVVVTRKAPGAGTIVLDAKYKLGTTIGRGDLDQAFLASVLVAAQPVTRVVLVLPRLPGARNQKVMIVDEEDDDPVGEEANERADEGKESTDASAPVDTAIGDAGADTASACFLHAVRLPFPGSDTLWSERHRALEPTHWDACVLEHAKALAEVLDVHAKAPDTLLRKRATLPAPA